MTHNCCVLFRVMHKPYPKWNFHKKTNTQQLEKELSQISNEIGFLGKDNNKDTLLVL